MPCPGNDQAAKSKVTMCGSPGRGEGRNNHRRVHISLEVARRGRRAAQHSHDKRILLAPYLPTHSLSPPTTAGGGSHFWVQPKHEQLGGQLGVLKHACVLGGDCPVQDASGSVAPVSSATQVTVRVCVPSPHAAEQPLQSPLSQWVGHASGSGCKRSGRGEGGDDDT